MSKTEAILSAAEMLAAVPYFNGLEVECPATLESLSRAAIRQAYESGQVVFLEGEACLGLHMVQAS